MLQAGESKLCEVLHGITGQLLMALQLRPRALQQSAGWTA